MRTRVQMLQLVASVAAAAIADSTLPPEDMADIHEGLAALLPPRQAEAARYAATCIRESQRARRDFLAVMQNGEALP